MILCVRRCSVSGGRFCHVESGREVRYSADPKPKSDPAKRPRAPAQKRAGDCRTAEPPRLDGVVRVSVQ